MFLPKKLQKQNSCRVIGETGRPKFQKAAPLWSPSIFGSIVKIWAETDGDITTDLTNTDSISSVPNKGYLGGTFTQSTKVKQPILNKCNDKTAALYELNSGETLVSDFISSGYSFLHSGTGATICLAYYPEAFDAQAVLFSSMSVPASEIGIAIIANVDKSVSVIVSNGSAAIIDSTSAADVLRLQTTNIITFCYETGSSPEYFVNVNGTRVAYGSASGTPSLLEATSDLYWGKYASSGSFGSNVLIDGDMELANVDSWGSSDARIIKENGCINIIGDGTRFMRISKNGTSPCIYQVILEGGTTYQISGWARGDGHASPSIIDGQNNTIWSGTSSTTGQYFDILYSVPGVSTYPLQLCLIGGANGNYVDFDDVSVLPDSAAYDTSTAQGYLPCVIAISDYISSFDLSSLEQYVSSKWRRDRETLKILLLGDNMITGGITAGWRPAFWSDIISKYGTQVAFVGPNVGSGDIENGDYTLGNWYHAGFDGYTFEQLTVVAKDIVYESKPDIVYIMAGVQNVGLDQTGEEMYAHLQELLAAVAAGGVSITATYVSKLPPWNSGLDDPETIAARNVNVVSFNTNINNDSGYHMVEAAGLLDVAELGSSGIYPNDDGNVVIQQSWSDTFGQFLGSWNNTTSVVPRPFTSHATQSHVQLGDNSDTLSFRYDSTIDVGDGSFMIGLWFYPTALTPSGIRPIFQYASPASQGLLIAHNSGSLLVGLNSDAIQFTAPAAFTVDTWHRVVVVGDSSEHKVSAFVNGKFCGSADASWDIAVTEAATLGSIDGYSSYHGIVCDLTICKDSESGFRIPSHDDIYDDYYGTVPFVPVLPGISFYCPMHDGSGTHLNPQIGGNGVGDIAGVGYSWITLAMPGG